MRHAIVQSLYGLFDHGDTRAHQLIISTRSRAVS
jgi:hypothetical protein